MHPNRIDNFKKLRPTHHQEERESQIAAAIERDRASSIAALPISAPRPIIGSPPPPIIESPHPPIFVSPSAAPHQNEQPALIQDDEFDLHPPAYHHVGMEEDIGTDHQVTNLLRARSV
jgi:hypothetical protein